MKQTLNNEATTRYQFETLLFSHTKYRRVTQNMPASRSLPAIAL